MKLTLQDEASSFVRKVLEGLSPEGDGPLGRGNVEVVILFGLPPQDVYRHRFGCVETAVRFLMLALRKFGEHGESVKAKIKDDVVRVDACVATLPERDARDVSRALAAYP